MRPVASRVAVDRIGCRASKPVTAVDTTGAGDTFSGVLAKCLASGDDTGAAVRAAATAVSLTVTVARARSGVPQAARIKWADAGRTRRLQRRPTETAGPLSTPSLRPGPSGRGRTDGPDGAECEFQLSVGPESGVRFVGRGEVERDLRTHLAPATGRRPEAVGTGKHSSVHFAVTRRTSARSAGTGRRPKPTTATSSSRTATSSGSRTPAPGPGTRISQAT
ncbi:PfkB family carbohydrate kinase [Streptomyces sp. NPDC047079]|uniref:PfkB family carbohydrate kinase n=1 Tax=Streptomyces sp. NPDC047079 TaxID=3154607 RepID=UPI0033C54405